MTQQGSYPPTAADAYDAMAPIYDRFNEANDYEVWLGEVLLPELEKHRLQVGRVLDVGCGTGRAFDPLVRRGWQVTGCDTSSEMLTRAWEKLRETREANLSECDARDLPKFPKPFDLILLLNDVVNYLTEDGDLERCFSGVKKNLAEGGLVCFDANPLALFESSFVAGGAGGEASAAPLKERGWNWNGLTTEPEAGGIFEVEFSGEGVEPAIHRERHHPPEEIARALEASGLRVLAVLGQREEGDRIFLEDPPDEDRHYKLIFIGGHDA